MRRAACVLLLLSAGVLSAADPAPVPAPLTIDGPEKVPAYKLVRLAAKGADPKAALIWDVNDEERADEDESGGRLVFTAPPGTYKVKLREITLDVATGAAKVRTARLTVTIGDPPPPPPPPGPTPGPGPNPPPGPTPNPDAPFAGVTGLHVLVVYESGDLPKMPAGQQSVLYSQANRTFLDSVTPVGADGKTHEWRMWDKDVSAGTEAKHWQDAMKRPRASAPWVLIGNGKAGYEGPLPSDVAGFQALVKVYAK